VEALEEGLLENPDTERLQDIHRLRREVIGLGRAIWPMRELVSHLERSESPLLSGALRPFVRDLYDHIIQVHEAFESLREIVASVLEVYLSSVNNRLNGVMKYLTLISTIFIPMTFVTGLYGMNFRFMPELGSPWGYPAALAVMACIGVGMVFFFRRRKWF
jgi:magnesium transporter